MSSIFGFVNRAKTFYYSFIIFIVFALFLLIMTNKGEVNLWLNQRHHIIFDLYFKYITYLGDGLFIIPVLLIVILFISKYEGVLISGSVLFTFFIIHILKNFIYPDSPRPISFFDPALNLYFIEGLDIHAYNSFPSGHTGQAFAIFCTLALLTNNKTLQFLFFILAYSTGISRIYLMQHFLLDVTVGSCIAVTISTFWVFLMHRYLTEHHKFPQWDKPLLNFKNDKG